VGEGCTIPENETARNCVVIQNKKHEGNFNFAYLHDDGDASIMINEDGLLTSLSGKLIKHKLFLAYKRLIDIVFSLIGLILALPIFTVVALLIKLDSSGPVIFSQRRCGKNGEEFDMYKFRTMVADAEERQKQLFDHKDIDGPMFKMKKDPRITRIGKYLRRTSLDELPQLLNVLKGEMSLIGPRPLIMEEMQFAPSWRDIRLRVKPGITGLWQINGRSEVAFHDWIKNDINYVKNQSLKQDMKIFLKTISSVARFIGAI
jgi:lipopolysaccharide/colanic/teichoic acid biosynthesis glycosyltransferase